MQSATRRAKRRKKRSASSAEKNLKNLTKLPFQFPPESPGQWRQLNRRARGRWLAAAHHRRFTGGWRPQRVPGRTVALEGRLVEDRVSFYCAIGEAVNGPGGSFGASMAGFDDCLFGGFGVESPYTIIWKESALSRAALGSQAYPDYLEHEIDPEQWPEPAIGEARARKRGGDCGRPAGRALAVRDHRRNDPQRSRARRHQPHPDSGVSVAMRGMPGLHSPANHR